jgi:phosphopantothenoylcysteine decarboxylase
LLERFHVAFQLISLPMNILIGLTGSVASIKIYNLVEDILEAIPHATIRIVTTEKALHFFDSQHLSKFTIYRDEDEWKDYKRGDPVLHIDIRNWADLFVIAPMDANTIGKMACGLCDNLLTCILRAWDPSKRIILAPAMNTAMWNHPITKQQLDIIRGWGFVDIIQPISKKLACGDIGIGAMEETRLIAEFIKASQ